MSSLDEIFTLLKAFGWLAVLAAFFTAAYQGLQLYNALLDAADKSGKLWEKWFKKPDPEKRVVPGTAENLEDVKRLAAELALRGTSRFGVQAASQAHYNSATVLLLRIMMRFRPLYLNPLVWAVVATACFALVRLVPLLKR